jgi:uncharacterized protein YuzE
VEIGETAVQFRFDEEANALYIALKAGDVVRTIEVTDMVYIDVDADGAPLGIEFVSADEFVPFLRRLHALEQSHEWSDVIPVEVRELFFVGAA